MFRLKSLIIVINVIILIFAIELFFIFILNFKTEIEMNTVKEFTIKIKISVLTHQIVRVL